MGIRLIYLRKDALVFRQACLLALSSLSGPSLVARVSLGRLFFHVIDYGYKHLEMKAWRVKMT